MLLVARLQHEAQEASVEVDAVAGAFVVDGDDVAARLGYDLRHAEELSRLVGQLDGEHAAASALAQSAGDDAREDVDVDVSARNHCDDFLPLYGNLAEHGRGHGDGARSFGYELVFLDEAEDDANEAITRASRSLPDWAETPQVLRMDSMSGSEVMTLSLSGNYDTATLQKIAEDDIVPLLERIEGVAEAEAFGGPETVYEVQVHADRLEAYSLSFSDIASALSSANVQTTGGEITEDGTDYQISIDERYMDVSDIADTVIETRNGVPIRISDVADIRVGEDDSRRESYYNGSPIISISVTADSDSNETTVASAVRAALPSIIEVLPDNVSLEIQRDSTEMISDTMNEVYNSAVQGVIFAALVIFLFLRGIKSTIIISLSMPICILITLMFMAVFGLSVNSMSMAGLILGIGMIVDASIIILENTYSFRLKGEKSAIAAILGSRDMFAAILGSTLTTICTFLPLLIFKNELEMIGVMFQDLIITVCISLCSSLFVAVTLVPALCGSILKLNTRTQKPLRSRLLRAIDMSIKYGEDRLREGYARLLSYFLDHKAMLIIPLALLFILSIQSLGNIAS